jgi:hypothetical protein
MFTRDDLKKVIGTLDLTRSFIAVALGHEPMGAEVDCKIKTVWLGRIDIELDDLVKRLDKVLEE